MQKNYYQILQVDPSADPEGIRAAYKRLSIKHHPDTNPSDNANQRMQEINAAYQVLKDPSSRADYDLYLKSTHEAPIDSDGGNGLHQSGASAKAGSSAPRRPSGPQHVLANLIVSLSFPLTYILLVFLLFRIFRSPGIFVTLLVVILAGLVAYQVTYRVERTFRLRR